MKNKIFVHINMKLYFISFLSRQKIMYISIGCWNIGILNKLYILGILLPHWPVRVLTHQKLGLSHMTQNSFAIFVVTFEFLKNPLQDNIYFVTVTLFCFLTFIQFSLYLGLQTDRQIDIQTLWLTDWPGGSVKN